MAIVRYIRRNTQPAEVCAAAGFFTSENFFEKGLDNALLMVYTLSIRDNDTTTIKPSGGNENDNQQQVRKQSGTAY